MTKVIIAGTAAAVAIAVLVSAAFAAFTLGGGASIVAGGNTGNASRMITDIGNTSATDDFSLVRFVLPTGTKLADISTLSADYKFTTGTCGGGSPRFQLAIDTDGDNVSNGNIFVYFGPSPSFTGCAMNTWQNTGNFIGNNDSGRYDSSQVGGPGFGTYAGALAALGANHQVLRITVVTDSFAASGAHTVLIDNVDIDGDVETFEPPADKDACKDGGWEGLTRADFSPFENQGDCIAYVNTGG